MMSTTQPAGTVVEAVAERERVSPSDLPPLDDFVDSSIAEILGGTRSEIDREFTFTSSYEITVRPTGEIRIEP